MPDSDPKTLQPPAPPIKPPSLSEFTEAQRKALVSEIVQEMRRDSLKDEVSRELEKADWGKRISKFFQHQAVLLMISFAITGYIGVKLANSWQSQEWERQQLRLLDIEGFQLKHKLIDDIAKSVGERNAAAQGIITPLIDDRLTDEQLIKEAEEPKKNWQKVDFEWRAKVPTLKLKIATLITSQDAVTKATEKFEMILANEQEIYSKMTLVMNDLKKYRHEQQKIDEVKKYIEQTQKILAELASLVTAEARKDIEGRQP